MGIYFSVNIPLPLNSGIGVAHQPSLVTEEKLLFLLLCKLRMKVSLQQSIHAEKEDLVLFLRDFLKYKRYVLLLGIISLLYISVILFYTHGALMFDGNYAGFYHLVPSLFTTPNGLLEGVSLLISQGNIYVAYYVYQYLSIFSLLIASFYLSLQILSKFVPKDLLLISSAVAASLSFIEPFVLVDYYSSLLGNYWLNGTLFTSALFTLFLAFLLRCFSSMRNKSKFLNSSLLSGLFLGLSVTPFPEDVRILILGYLLFFAMMIFILIHSHSDGEKVAHGKFPLSMVAFVITSFIFSLFDTYPMLSINGLQHYYSAASISGAGFVISFNTGNFNTIPQVIRLFGMWTFPTNIIVYHSIYYGINVVNISSYFWPLLALFFPLFFAYRIKENRGFLLFIMILVILSIFWEKGGNPSLGSIWYFGLDKIPIVTSIFATGFLQYYVMGMLYPVLATLSIFKIYTYVKKVKRLRKRLRRIVVLVPIALAVILVVAEMPVFDGQLEENPWAPKSSGFYVPSEYEYARDYLLTNSQNVLLFPGLGTWITTSWNYDGASGFYYNFFQPINVTNVYALSATSAFSSNALETNSLLNAPFANSANQSSLNIEWLREIVSLNISYIIFDFTLLPDQILYNYAYYVTAIQLLVLEGIASLTLSFKDLKIYKIDIPQIISILGK